MGETSVEYDRCIFLLPPQEHVVIEPNQDIYGLYSVRKQGVFDSKSKSEFLCCFPVPACWTFLAWSIMSRLRPFSLFASYRVWDSVLAFGFRYVPDSILSLDFL